MSWQSLPGWSDDIERFYPWLADRLPPNALHVEVGAFMFRSVACMATLRPDVTVLCIDPWEADYKYLSGVDLVDLGGLIEDADILMRMPFYEAAITSLRKHADLGNIIVCRSRYVDAKHVPADSIFIDADHTYESGMADLTHAATMLKPGGILCGHDYEYQIDGKRDRRFATNPLFPGLVRAVDEYAAAIGKRVVVGTGSKTDWSTCYRFE